MGRAALVDSLTADAAQACLELAGPGVETPLTALELRHLGGALRSATPDPGAAGPLHSEVLVYAIGTPVTPEVGAAIHTALDTMSERLAPWSGERRTLITFDADGAGLRQSFTSAVADRLAAVTASYDGDGLLVANHAVD
jgi:hypothetical protein